MSKYGGSRMDRPLLGFPKKQAPKVTVGWFKTDDAIIIVASATKKRPS